MRIQRYATSDEIADAGFIECTDNGFNSREFHELGSIAVIVGLGRRRLKSFLATHGTGTQ